jgi:aminopeptidase N
MENWGLVTYREVALLYEEGETHFDKFKSNQRYKNDKLYF